MLEKHSFSKNIKWLEHKLTKHRNVETHNSTNRQLSLVLSVDIIVSTRSAPLPATSPEPAAALASSKSEKLTSDIFPDIEVIKDVHVTRLILIPLSLNKIELEEFVVDDLEKSFDNNEVSYENLGETIAVTKLGELFNNQN